MRQILLIVLALTAVTLVTSCEFEDIRPAPESIIETTWAVTVTNDENVTASSVLKFGATTYNVVTTYIKQGESMVRKASGAYTYDDPMVTMVVGSGDDLELVVATIYNARMYIQESTYVFDRQF